ncbi:hypothetical protein H4R99_003848 [Coemansia sp. RSA 1722]|nr:High mobility group protein 20A [Coemansia sp. RSA 485]KAJ2599083.1 hypothetical protein H4R99_003848 [Coemansia sp. RSA 1722]
MSNYDSYHSGFSKDIKPLKLRPLTHSRPLASLPSTPTMASAPATSSAFTSVTGPESQASLRLAPVQALLTPMSPIQPLPLPSLSSITNPLSASLSSSQIRTGSQIMHESDAAIYYYSLKNDEFIRRPLDQIVGPNGKVYIEHVPGHNVITLPKDISLQRFGRRINRKTFLKLQSVEKSSDKPTKPLNVFIRYRSANLKRARREFPGASQTDISRILAEQWKNEDPKIKESFINGFLADNYQYNLRFKEWKTRTEQKEFDRLDDYDPQGSPYGVNIPTPYSSDIQDTSARQLTMDMSAYGGPANFNPARRRSYSVPPQGSDRHHSAQQPPPPLKRQRVFHR